MWVDEGYSSETLPPSQSNGHNTRVQKSPGREQMKEMTGLVSISGFLLLILYSDYCTFLNHDSLQHFSFFSLHLLPSIFSLLPSCPPPFPSQGSQVNLPVLLKPLVF